MRCPRCGAQVAGNWKFCPQCGAALAEGPSGPPASSEGPHAGAPAPPVTTAVPPFPGPQGSPSSAVALGLHYHGPAQRSLYYLALAILGVVMLFLSAIVLGILREQAQSFPAFVISLVMAVLPVPIYATLIVVLDRHRRGPGWLLFGAFFWGAVVAVLLAIEANTRIDGLFVALLGRQWANLLTPSLVAPFVEETSKGLALLLIYRFMRFDFNDVVDGIVYGALVGLGFAMTENVIYFSRAYHAGGLENASITFYFRAILGGFGHSLYTACTGAGLGLAEETDNPAVRWIAPFAGYCAAMFLHFLWNTVLNVPFPPHSNIVEFLIVAPFLTAALTFPGIFTLLAITLFAWRRETRVITDHLRDEVERGVVRPGEYALLRDDRRRAAQVWRTLFHYGPLAWFMLRQFYNLEMGLAFRKWHTARGERLPATAQGQSEDAYREHIAALRARLNSMGVPVEPALTTLGPAVESSPLSTRQLTVHRRTSPTLRALTAGAALVVIALLADVGDGAYHVLKFRRADPSGPVGVEPRPPAEPQAPRQPHQPVGPQAPSPPPDPLPPQPPAQAEMLAYRDPEGAFGIEYPKTWKVRRGENGYTVFYQSDPEEGALFGVFPRLLLDGEATAAQIVEALQQDVRKRYPDFEVKQQTIEPDPAGNGETASVRAGWTNGRSERMTTLLLFHIDRPGDGQSRLLLFNLQAPEVAFSAVEPTFHHMLKSYAR